MSRTLIYLVIKDKIDNKLKNGSTPILLDVEIDKIIDDVKETAIFTSQIFINNGILIKDNDTYKLSDEFRTKS